MTFDHKAGFNHVPLDKHLWQYFGFEWGGTYYVSTTVSFGLWLTPYIYHSLSVVVMRDIHSRGAPVLTWIDCLYFTSFPSTST